MKYSVVLGLVVILLTATACKQSIRETVTPSPQGDALALPQENHFNSLKQLTFGGQNAEAYFSYDGSKLIFQSTRDALQCDAIFEMNTNGKEVKLLSSGKGVTTCAFISPGEDSIIYASTHLAGEKCPPKPDYSKGYVWSLYKSFDIFRAKRDGSELQQLTHTEGYDAEAVYSPQGDRIVFTSVRTGDLELFLMKPDGSQVEQITHEDGYDGGAFFSRDGQWLVWRASRPKGKQLESYQSLLAEGLIRPRNLEIFIMHLKERKPIQITNNGAANFGPYWHPDGKHIIFSSNMHNPHGRNFDLFLVNIETRRLQQVTYYEGFDGFPMFSHDGKKLVFASNRNGKVQGETNIFIVDWSM
ncbi:MAG: hypothetical protein OEZ68_13745 [Gammaproteobacteria bacterium]|nr:hypothetical protein [Gammaproteobacteria bacterium]MDH5801865.1 hypothetical protein [Gammaproteobacteria bacterium]